MSNPSKAKGTRAETKVANYLTANGLRTARRPLAGSADKGDLCMLLPSGEEVTLEVKAGKQTQNFPRSRMDRWKRETLQEGRNAKSRCALVVVRYKRSFDDAEVWLPNSQWGGVNGWTMIHMDMFVDAMTHVDAFADVMQAYERHAKEK